MSRQPAARSCSMRWEPRKPAPPVTTMRLLSRVHDFMTPARYRARRPQASAPPLRLRARLGQVGIDHHVDEFFEADVGLPAELRWRALEGSPKRQSTSAGR